ncbi:MAG: hypothetical protein ACK41W_18030, partial [Cyanobacteriota bacterium]
MSSPGLKRRLPRVWRGVVVLALAQGAALLGTIAGTGAGGARTLDSAPGSTAGLERGWRELERQLRLLDRLLPLDALPAQ